jgi:hypothetical protein
MTTGLFNLAPSAALDSRLRGNDSVEAQAPFSSNDPGFCFAAPG